VNWIRHNAGVAALVIVCLSIAGGFHALNREGEQRTAAVRTEARARSRVDRARTAQLRWDKTAADHAACARQAASRIEVRRTFDDVFDSIARFASTERVGEVLRVVDAEKRTVSKALPTIDCEKIAPPPKGPRPRIP
jgi:formate-dependent nitrite reductase cytochrome c552 subunit